MSREVLQKVMAVLDEVKRLDDLRTEHNQRLSLLAKRARAGEPISVIERREAFDATVIDYGDVFADLKRLHPLVKKALK